MRNKGFNSFWMILIGCLMAIILVISLDPTSRLSKTDEIILNSMLYYLYFICLRTMLLLGLSFYEYLTSRVRVKDEHFPLVSIIIPCYNEENVIEDAVRSVLRIDYPNVEILIVDDGSKDNTFEKAILISQDERKVRVITKTNGGKASALNYGIRQAKGDYVLCLDADSELNTEVLRKGIPYFYEDKNLGAVAGSTRVRKAKTLLEMFQKLEYIIGLNFHKKAQSALGAVTIVPGPIGLFKKSALLEVGLYDKDTFAEDCDLTLKILMKGYRIRYCNEMIAFTEAPNTFYELCIQRYRWSRGMIQAIRKHIGKSKSKEGNRLRSKLIIVYMIIETMCIPSINFLFVMLTLLYALSSDGVSLFGPFFAGLVIMDATIALYSIITEKQILSLFFLSIFSRVTYGFSLEVMRFYSMVDEIFKLPMKWGKINRRGN